MHPHTNTQEPKKRLAQLEAKSDDHVVDSLMLPTALVSCGSMYSGLSDHRIDAAGAAVLDRMARRVYTEAAKQQRWASGARCARLLGRAP